MKKTILFFIIISNIFGQEKIEKKPDFLLKPFFMYANSSAYYDINGSLVTYETRIDPVKKDTFDYYWEHTKYTFGIEAEYFPGSNISLFAIIPFSFNTFRETEYHTDSATGIRQSSDNPTLNLNQFDYIGIGTRYKINLGKAYTNFNLEFRIPSSFKGGVLNNPDYPFLSHGAFEWLAGTGFGILTSKMLLEIEAKYNYRSKELQNQLLINTNARLSTVPGTYLSFSTESAISLKSFQNAVIYSPRNTPVQDSFFDALIGFGLLINKNINTVFSYRVKLLGKNSPMNGTFMLMAGINI